MQAGMDEGARMDHGGGRQHAEMLGAAGILHRPEEEALSPQVTEVGGHALLLLSLLHHCFVFQILDAQRRLQGNLDEGIAVTQSVTALLATKDQLPQLGTDAVRLSIIYS